MKIHFSVDDVLNSLRWCAFHRPDSIFNMDFYGDLKKWHESYGIKVTLYCFFGNRSDFCVEDLPNRYWEELKNQCGWLHMAYHGSMDEKVGKETFLLEKERFDELIGKSLSTSIVRLHCWKAPEGVFTRGAKGVFLCPDYDRLPYDLTAEEWERCKNTGSITKGSREYWVTDIRYDNLESPSQIDTLEKEKLVIFGHEWMYKEKRNLIEEILNRLGEVSYIF